REERQLAAEVPFTHRCGQSPELTKRDQVFHDFPGLVVTKQERFGPRGQFAFAPKRVFRPIFREDAQAGSAQAVRVLDLFTVDRLQQPAEKADAEFRRRLDPRGRKETLPEGLARPLLAVAEEGPTNAALVILGARERQRQQENTAIMRYICSAGQFGRPEG